MTRSETLAKFRKFVEYYGKKAREADDREIKLMYASEHVAWSEAADLLEQMEEDCGH